MRCDGRENSEIRKVKITTDYTKYAEGSVLIEMGDTKVICNATVEDRVPPHVFNTGSGWITAEYSMLPRATDSRNQRDIQKLKLSPRSAEIQRLIGRALRSAVDLSVLGERSIIVDCDVIQADGGTRCASITGGFIALTMAINKLLKEKIIEKNPIIKQVAAISVGKFENEIICDLCYKEDSAAEVDMNVIMTEKNEYIELQGTGEEAVFSDDDLNALLKSAKKGLKKLFKLQKSILDKIKE